MLGPEGQRRRKSARAGARPSVTNSSTTGRQSTAESAQARPRREAARPEALTAGPPAGPGTGRESGIWAVVRPGWPRWRRAGAVSRCSATCEAARSGQLPSSGVRPGRAMARPGASRPVGVLGRPCPWPGPVQGEVPWGERPRRRRYQWAARVAVGAARPRRPVRRAPGRAGSPAAKAASRHSATHGRLRGHGRRFQPGKGRPDQVLGRGLGGQARTAGGQGEPRPKRGQRRRQAEQAGPQAGNAAGHAG